ncbi:MULTISPECIES: hypothetical protein [Burkholderia cepacia complex]|uniref:hypothetical protein n=1 Tax=Burkholderia cepacia complex TaxID=87882 RepID=UPI0009B54D21|nr:MULTISPECIES: hypothetical protein [Burkholderia cepacia complex]MBH9648295.1 hypothetical protein [Burkholderia vietnamiensis]CAG9220315.1 hypothetical protein BVI1335_350039 [Burkholderia vietnamiensis]
MFEITGDDIAALNDEDLRTLVGRLCEAELRRRNLSPSAVTWGGNQTAKDGGLDVRVALPLGTAIDGFIPKTATGFQVKKPDMPRAAIIDEMRPKPSGVLRPVIIELAKASGAYIIVSATGSTSDSALTSRKKGMAEAVRDISDAANITLDFYDRNRVATWVRDHTALIPWVRSRIGRSIPGWFSYGAWSHPPEDADRAYLVDDAARIKTGAKNEEDGLSVTDGINRIRDVLRTPGHVVRLVGLSGVGKTRLVEALFDPEVGVNSLDPALAIYTNVAAGPDPQPAGLASDLIAARARAILVIDNCAPDVHRQLSDIARSADSTVSVVTIEYDIREDQPEGTDVFVLDTSSLTLIEKLVSNRFSNLSQIDARTIAEFSGGNARIALALAGTVQKNDAVAGLSDAELFQRLFHQRHDHDASLLSIAQACSLLYSFEGEKLSGEGAELSILGDLIGKSGEEVFGGVAELKRRDLLQERGPWRAVLPHAIANRLAVTALQNIPRSKLLSRLVENASPRVLRSFSRRLGYLDGSKEARAIVQSWLASDGLLADIPNLNALGRAMLDNIAPVMPEGVLFALENALTAGSEDVLAKCNHFIRLLRSLAYDEAYFERAVSLLVKFARLPGKKQSDGDAANVVESLFHIVLSGTHAPLELRLKVVDGLLRSIDAAEQDIGVNALRAMLKTGHFSSTYGFEFGARSRDYGYHPRTGQDVHDWFSAALSLAEPFALLETSLGERVREAIAAEFRGLWAEATVVDELDRLSRAIAAHRFWREGWIAVRRTRIYDGAGLPAEIRTRLTALEEFLRPKDLIDKVRGVVLGSNGDSVDLDDPNDFESDRYAEAAARAAAAVEHLGRDVAADVEAFRTLLPDLIGKNSHNVAGFGRGLALAADKPSEVWSAMADQVAITEKPSVGLLSGFLDAVQRRDRAEADAILDEALDDPRLAEWFPVVQASAIIDDKALGRLHRALQYGKAPIERFFSLAYGRTCDVIPGPALKHLVLAIGERPGGTAVAVEILSMRLHSDHSERKTSVPEVAEAGRELLAAYRFHRGNGRATMEDHELAVVVREALIDDKGKSIARKLCRDLLAAIASYETDIHEHSELVSALFQVRPVDVLDEFFSGDDKSKTSSIRLLRDLPRFHKNPMNVVPDDVVLGWCDMDPEARYPLVAAVALLFKRPNEKEPHEWTNLTRQLLLRAPDPEAVLNEIVSRLHSSSYSGSLATKLESRLTLLNRLDSSAVPALAAPLSKAKGELEKRIQMERQRETEEGRALSGRFE